MNRALGSDNTASRNLDEPRAPPHNLEVEQALLGALMVHPESWAHVGSVLRPEHFFDPLHARIFDAAVILRRDGAPVSPLTLKTFFERRNPDGDWRLELSCSPHQLSCGVDECC